MSKSPESSAVDPTLQLPIVDDAPTLGPSATNEQSPPRAEPAAEVDHSLTPPISEAQLTVGGMRNFFGRRRRPKWTSTVPEGPTYRNRVTKVRDGTAYIKRQRLGPSSNEHRKHRDTMPLSEYDRLDHLTRLRSGDIGYAYSRLVEASKIPAEKIEKTRSSMGFSVQIERSADIGDLRWTTAAGATYEILGAARMPNAAHHWTYQKSGYNTKGEPTVFKTWTELADDKDLQPAGGDTEDVIARKTNMREYVATVAKNAPYLPLTFTTDELLQEFGAALNIDKKDIPSTAKAAPANVTPQAQPDKSGAAAPDTVNPLEPGPTASSSQSTQPETVHMHGAQELIELLQQDEKPTMGSSYVTRSGAEIKIASITDDGTTYTVRSTERDGRQRVRLLTKSELIRFVR